MTHDGGDRTNKSGENQNAWRKRDIQILGKIDSGHHQTSEDERKN